MSPSVGVNVPRQELSIPRGSTAKVRLTVSKGGVPYNISLPETVLIFTARHRGVELFQHSWAPVGTALPAGVATGGITARTDLDVNIADVEIASADTAGLAASDVVSYDAWLYDAAGDVVPVVVGTIRIEALPYAPA